LQSSVFDDLLAALEAEGSSALAFDLPGHGRSGGLDALPSIEAMAETARWVTDACQIESTLIVGHGMGALIALEWAFSQPDDVAGLVLCGVGEALGIRDETIELMRSVTRGKAPRPFDPTRVAKVSGRDLMRRVYMEGIKTDPRATLGDLEASRKWSDALRKGPARALRRPLRVFTGSAEGEADRRRAAELLATLSNASESGANTSFTSSVIEDAAHFLPLEQPAAFAAEVSRFRREAVETS